MKSSKLDPGYELIGDEAAAATAVAAPCERAREEVAATLAWYENGEADDDGGDEFQGVGGPASAPPNVSNGDPKEGTELRPKGSSAGISMKFGRVIDVVVMCIGPRWENRD
mmetsp:Transcript_25985/g.40788  ORF Transcript_25985/g.40788 Transcript_25985/m.40788 type:complete len:111 (-) Transcript_25985:1164-1496(-)